MRSPTSRSSRRCLATATLLAVALAGCGGTGDSDTSSSKRVERCVDRLTRTVPPDADTSGEAFRAYVELTYCRQFEQNGLVYDDGALSIEAQEWLDRSGSEECAAAGGPGQSSSTVPCEELRAAAGPRSIDCALLHHVRKHEVQEYVEDLRSRGEVECDDGTLLEELGAP